MLDVLLDTPLDRAIELDRAVVPIAGARVTADLDNSTVHVDADLVRFDLIGSPAELLLLARDLERVLAPQVSHGQLIAEQRRRAHAAGVSWCPTCRCSAIGGNRTTSEGLSCSVCDTLLTARPAVTGDAA